MRCVASLSATAFGDTQNPQLLFVQELSQGRLENTESFGEYKSVRLVDFCA